MSLINEFYDQMAIKAYANNANKQEISSHTKRIYEAVKSQLISDMSLEEFAAFTGAFTSGKAGIGEKAQLTLLQQIFPCIKKLPSKGARVVRLTHDDNGSPVLARGITKKSSKVKSIKALDAELICNDKHIFFALRTQDIGSFSNSIGGGEQDNAIDEFRTLITTIGSNCLVYEGKPVEIFIVLDGRNSEAIIEEFSQQLPNNTCITITSCDRLHKQQVQ